MFKNFRTLMVKLTLLTVTISFYNVPCSFTCEANDAKEALKPLENTKSPLDSVPDIDYCTVEPNEMGTIMILMYHGLVKSKPHVSYQRTADDFKMDLKNLYEAGYRLVSLNDIIDNDIKVSVGYSPVAFVFDDGLSSTFSLESDVNGNLVPKEGCAVDILQKFAAEYPDFGNAATFAIIGVDEPFKGAGTVQERLKYLIDNGYDIANHTYSHKNLRSLDAYPLQQEIGKQHNNLKELLPDDYVVRSIVYPYGQRPKSALRAFAIKGLCDGIEYNYDIALREGQSGSSATPGHVEFDPLNAPRVRASENEETDLGWCLEYYKNNPQKRYVSDGDPDTVSVPKGYADKINLEDPRLFGKEVIIY
ncbi:MAG: polysaccharide deacetylase family protein [Defluviitaleaceae bacterium]|nr:polysaccharide deacetylase family protein [Defluviitaleaceae bacterium]